MRQPGTAPAYRLPPPRQRHRGREIGALLVTVMIAALVAGGAYVVSNGINHFLPGGLPFAAQPTPVPTLPALMALQRIQQLNPQSTLQVNSSLSNEVDLETIEGANGGVGFTVTTATQVLSLYMRGYPNQPLYRWVDRDSANQTTTVYEVHPDALWVITINQQTCVPQWTVWTIAPAALLARGATTANYTTGTAHHDEAGVPTGFSVSCP